MKRLVLAPLVVLFWATGNSLLAQTDSLVLTWQRELSPGIALQSSQFTATTMDDAGNVFAVGSTESAHGESDLLVVKYDALGQELWQATYDGPLHSHDAARWVFANLDGGVTVAGVSVAGMGGLAGPRQSLVIVRFGSDGLRAWARVIGPPSDSVNWNIQCLQRDDAGRLYVLVDEQVFGESMIARMQVVLRISATGDLLQENRLPGNVWLPPMPENMIVTARNELVFAATRTDSVWPGGSITRSCLYRYALDGTLLGTLEQLPSPNPSTRAISVGANRDGSLTAVVFETDAYRFVNCYDHEGLAVWSRVIDTLQSGWAPRGVPTMHMTPDSVLWIVRGSIQSLVERFSASGTPLSMWNDAHPSYGWLPVSSWADSAGGMRMLRMDATFDDIANDSIVCTAFDRTGGFSWRVHIPCDAPPVGAVAPGGFVDAIGDLYALSASGSIRNAHATISKITPQGSVHWTNRQTAEGSANASVVAMTKGVSGALFLTGTAVNTRGFFDLFTARVSAQGDPEWVRIYDSPEGRHEIPVRVLTNGSGGVYTVAYTRGGGFSSIGSYLLVKYTADGEFSWLAQHAATAPGNDQFELRDAHLDAEARTWLAGSAGTLCFDSTGTLVRQDPRSSWAVTSDAEGRVFIAGPDSISAFDPAGNPLWTSSTALWLEPPMDMEPDGAGGVVVTCGSYRTFRMDSAGVRLWTKGFGANRLLLDAERNIILVFMYGGVAKLSLAGDSLYHVPNQQCDWASTAVSALGDGGTVYVSAEGEYSFGGPLSGHAWLTGIGPGGNVSASATYIGPDLAYSPQAMCAGENGDVYLASDVHFLGMQRLPLIQKFQRFTVGVDTEEEHGVPIAMELAQNYPNPFNPVTTMSYKIPVGTRHAVSLRVYDVLGREVVTLVNEPKEPGVYTVRWDASGVASGVYFYRLMVGEKTAVRKMLVMK